MLHCRRFGGTMIRSALLAALLATGLIAEEQQPPRFDPLVEEIESMVIEDIDPADLTEPGSDILARGLAEVLAESDDLATVPLAQLRLRTAEAWLDAEVLESATKLVEQVLAVKSLPDWTRDRAGEARVACWELELRQAEDLEQVPDPVEAIKAYGGFGLGVTARAWSVTGQRHHALKDFDQALKAYDAGLELLTDADARARVPLYSLRVLSMEAAGTEPKVIHDWLQERREDPAVRQIVDAVLTSSDKLIGQPAPPLAAALLEGAGRWDLKEQQGRPVLVYFFATWVEACRQVSPAIATFAKDNDLPVVGVSLDTAETLKNLPAFKQATGTDYTLIGDRIGWDSELDDDWHVQTIPALYLVDGEGLLVAKDLAGKDGDETMAKLTAALAAGGDAAGEPAAEPEAAIDGDAIEEEDLP